MECIECNGINSFLVLASQLLLEKSIIRNVRGYKCFELPEPIVFEFSNPCSRLITIPERKWNIFLAYAESLWIASGRNDLLMISHYLKKMENFSDDGQFLRGAYGPRIRTFNSSHADYKNNSCFNIADKSNNLLVDQFSFVVECFKIDPFTRQAVIQIGDPNKDCFDNFNNKKYTKDFPCTRTLHFIKDVATNKLNLIVQMRSNDLIWGASAVNIFNFTFMLEYMSKILNIEVGKYYHIVDNLHYYSNFQRKIDKLSKINDYEDPCFIYNDPILTLSEFNKYIQKLSRWEEKLRNKLTNELLIFENDFFDDWAKIFYVFNTKNKVDFINPILNNILWKRSSYGCRECKCYNS